LVSTHSCETPGSHHLRQPVDVDRVDVHALLDLHAHLLGPRLGTEDPDLAGDDDRRVDALALELVDAS
jgi:hypothetical protein